MPILNIILEAAWDIAVIPFGHQNSFYATLQFMPEQAYVAALAATLGAIGGIAFNWCVGQLLHKRFNQLHPDSARYVQLKTSFAEYGWPLLLLTWIPVGGFLPLVAAALGYPLKKTLVLCGFAMAGFYIYQLVAVV